MMTFQDEEELTQDEKLEMADKLFEDRIAFAEDR